MTDKDDALVERALDATRVAREVWKTKPNSWTAYVGAALEVEDGTIFTGVNLDLECGVGFCAEHSAAAELVKAGHRRIARAVACTVKGRVIPPCGRCRELMYQLDPVANVNAVIITGPGTTSLLRDLLPAPWQESFD